MSLKFAVRIANPPLPLSWSTPESLLRTLENLLEIRVPGQESLRLVSVGADEPDANNRGMPWFQLDEHGRLVDAMFYSGGEWRPMFAHASVGDIRAFQGVGADVEQPWALCDGSSGVPNLLAQMVKTDGNPPANAGEAAGNLRMGLRIFVGYA